MKENKTLFKGAGFLALLLALTSCGGGDVSSSSLTSGSSSATSQGTSTSTSSSNSSEGSSSSSSSEGSSSSGSSSSSESDSSSTGGDSSSSSGSSSSDSSSSSEGSSSSSEGSSSSSEGSSSSSEGSSSSSDDSSSSSSSSTSSEVTKYTISFDSKGGSDITAITVNEGTVATKPTDPTYEGFDFGGWYKETEITNAYDWTSTVNSNFTLYAKWTAVVVKHTITFVTNGGSDVAALEVVDGEAATKPTDPTRNYYTFDKWYSDENCTAEYVWTSLVTADLTLYAKWTFIPQTIYFRDVSWWHADGAGSSIYLYNSDTDFASAWPGALMTHKIWDETNNYNLWSVELTVDYTYCIYARVKSDGSVFWGAQTVDITLADRGTHNLYDISGVTDPTWFGDGNKVTGVWGDYSA